MRLTEIHYAKKPVKIKGSRSKPNRAFFFTWKESPLNYGVHDEAFGEWQKQLWIIK